VEKAPAKPTQGSPKAASKSLAKLGDLKKGKRPVLVPVDFSAHSEAALAHAAHQAERTQAPLVVLHVVHDPGEAPGYYHVKGRKKQLRRLEDVASEMFDKFMAKMIKRHPKLTAIKKSKRILVSGLPATRILEVAMKVEPRIVVMGSAGRTGLSRFLLGSKAEQLLRTCPYPVTIVKTAKK
jgi:nucleotide-binding universal stress UspA family protein